MRLTELSLFHFRNIKQLTLKLDETVNFFIGANAQGKTSILEAIHVLSQLDSFRTHDLEDLIEKDFQHARIECRIQTNETRNSNQNFSENWQSHLAVVFEKQNFGRNNAVRTKKTAQINGKTLRSQTQYLAERFKNSALGFHAVVFNPEDHELIRGEPRVRRTFLNRAVSAENFDYLQNLKAYGKVLEQRNYLLREQRRDAELFDVYSAELVRLSAKITYARFHWLNRMNLRLPFLLQKITQNQPVLSVDFLSRDLTEIFENSSQFPLQARPPSLEDLERLYVQRLAQVEANEWFRGATLFGPHKDDLLFTLGGQTALKSYGSQGEIRSALLATKLAEIEMYREATGLRPVLLLDDFSSELDEKRRSSFLTFLLETDLQTFVTTTDARIYSGRRFWIENGEVTEGIHERNQLDNSLTRNEQERILSR